MTRSTIIKDLLVIVVDIIITCIIGRPYFYLKMARVGLAVEFLPSLITAHEPRIINVSRKKVGRKKFCLAKSNSKSSSPWNDPDKSEESESAETSRHKVYDS